MIFDIFIGLISMIALSLTFFLLLVSTRQNVRDNIWEYGVLRSIGFTKAQGQRLYMYEAFFVVFSATLLGICIGVVTAALVTAQLCLFLQLQPFVALNYYLLGITVVISFFTTFFAVQIPIAEVNKRQIASVLKSTE